MRIPAVNTCRVKIVVSTYRYIYLYNVTFQYCRTPICLHPIRQLICQFTEHIFDSGYFRAVWRPIYCNKVVGKRTIVNHVSNIRSVVAAEILPYEKSLVVSVTWGWISLDAVQDIVNKICESILIQITLTYHHLASWMRHRSIYPIVYSITA